MRVGNHILLSPNWTVRSVDQPDLSGGSGRESLKKVVKETSWDNVDFHQSDFPYMLDAVAVNIYSDKVLYRIFVSFDSCVAIFYFAFRSEIVHFPPCDRLIESSKPSYLNEDWSLKIFAWKLLCLK